MKKIFLYIVVVIFSKCNIAGDCENQVLLKIINNSKSHKIVKFDRGCGATTSNNIQLSVLKFSDSLSNEAGNIFISDSSEGVANEEDIGVQVYWLNDSSIKIIYPKDLQVFKKDSLVNNFKVIYETK